ncbi:MAG: cysteine desulfurase [Clostridia bacterium]|nr:cysteine desulfurase [Clostridia bacterium]
MIFLDNASTTKLDREVWSIIEKYSFDEFYNPSAPYYRAKEISNKIKDAKNLIIKALNGASGSNFIFTSSATESNNSVLLGQLNKRFKKVLISSGEHNSISSTITEIERKGFEVILINLNKDGQVDIDDFKAKMDDNVGLVSIIHASNETGAVNDIETLVKITKAINPNCLFHCDGVQAFGKIKVDLKSLNVDYYTISAHKIHGPKGIAGLYVKSNFKPYILGGGQQEGLRSGTENVPNIFAFANICERLDYAKNYDFIVKLRNEFIKTIRINENIIINNFANSSPYILSLILKGVNGETIVNALEKYDIFVGLGSACSSKKVGNATLEAIGFNKEIVKGSIRISFDASNTVEEVVEAGKKILEIYESLYNQVNRRK